MKALLVSEDKNKLFKLKSFLNSAGYDTICYNWLVKALDNIEEIAPHLIVLSAEDYPRHWKVFVQHVKTNLKDREPQIILLAKNLSQDEKNKCDVLGITEIISDIDLEKDKLLNTIENLSQLEESDKEANINILTFTVVNPLTNNVVTGKIKKYDYPTIHFLPDNPDAFSTLRFGQIFENCKLKQIQDEEELVTNHRCQIQGFTNDSIEFCLLR